MAKKEAKQVELNPDAQPQQQKVSRDEFREAIKGRYMINQKTFEQCSRVDLFEIIVALERAIKMQNEKIKKQEARFLKNRIKALFEKAKSFLVNFKVKKLKHGGETAPKIDDNN